METLSLLGNIASILGLGISIIVFLRLGSIQKSYSRQALVPKLIGKLRTNAKNIESRLADKAYAESRSEFALARVNLRSISDHVRRRPRKELAILIVKVNAAADGRTTGAVHELQSEALGAIRTALLLVQNLCEKWKWGNRDAN